LPEWLPEVAVGTAAAAVPIGLFTWFFPSRHEAAEPAPRRAARAAAAIALVLGLMMSAQHIWPRSTAAMLLAGAAAILALALIRGLAARLAEAAPPRKG
jgi:hypothetical protein